MTRYSEKLADKIIKLIEEDNYTTTDICHIIGISRMTLHRWKEANSGFSEAMDEAAENRQEKLRQQARKGLRRKLEVNKQIETKTVYIPSKDNPEELILKEYVVKEKQRMPDTSAIAYTLSDKISAGKKDIQPDQTQTPLVVIVKDEATKRGMLQLQQNMNTKKNQ